MSSMIRIYSLASFDRGAKARWLLTEMGVPFEDHRLSGEKKEYESPEYLKLNPMGRVPVLKHGDTAIFESAAIVAYLADLYPEKGMAPAVGSPARAKYLQWVAFATATLDTLQRRIMMAEDIPAGEIHKAKNDELVAELKGAMAALDAGLSGGAPYLVGHRLSAADICVGYHLYWLRMWPELDAHIKTHGRVVSYLDGLKALPSAVKADVFSYKE